MREHVCVAMSVYICVVYACSCVYWYRATDHAAYKCITATFMHDENSSNNHYDKHFNHNSLIPFHG